MIDLVFEPSVFHIDSPDGLDLSSRLADLQSIATNDNDLSPCRFVLNESYKDLLENSSLYEEYFADNRQILSSLKLQQAAGDIIRFFRRLHDRARDNTDNSTIYKPEKTQKIGKITYDIHCCTPGEKEVLCKIFEEYLTESVEQKPLLYVGLFPQIPRKIRLDSNSLELQGISTYKDLEEKLSDKTPLNDEEAKIYVQKNWSKLQRAEDIEKEFKHFVEEYIKKREWPNTICNEYCGISKIWNDVDKALNGNEIERYHFVEYFANRMVNRENEGRYSKSILKHREKLKDNGEYHFPVSATGRIFYRYGNNKKIVILRYEFNSHH